MSKINDFPAELYVKISNLKKFNTILHEFILATFPNAKPNNNVLLIHSNDYIMVYLFLPKGEVQKYITKYVIPENDYAFENTVKNSINFPYEFRRYYSTKSYEEKYGKFKKRFLTPKKSVS